MVINKKHIGLGIVVAVIIAGVIVWLNGEFLAGKLHDALGKSQAVCAEHGGEQEGKEDVKEAKQDDKDTAARANLDPKEIEKIKCEHKIRQIDCDECRYELGVVKIRL